MKVDDEVFDKIVDSVKTGLQSFHSHKHKARLYAKRFLNGFSDSDRDFILKEILYQQNKSIVKAVGNKQNISIPSLGSFQYRETLEVIRDIKNEVKKEFNVTDIRKCDPDKAEAIIEEINIRKKHIILPLYFKQLGGKGSSVNHNFLNDK